MTTREPKATAYKPFPFDRYKVAGLAVSTLAILLSIYFMVVKGFNFGVDFIGGYKLVYQFEPGVTEAKLREVLDPLGLGEIQLVQFGSASEGSFLIKAKFDENRQVISEVKQALTASVGQFTVLSEEMVGPKVGAELRQKGLLALFLSWALIAVYVAWRFTIQFAPGALIALVHDVVVALGFFTFFEKEFNLPILAAVLTIVGYSINDTIVIYDRIRENLKKFPSSMTLSDIVDRSLTETLSRTIVTSLTLFFAVVVLFFLGGAVLHDFAFCMIVGVVVGTYSSLFVATPIYIILCKYFPQKK